MNSTFFTILIILLLVFAFVIVQKTWYPERDLIILKKTKNLKNNEYKFIPENIKSTYEKVYQPNEAPEPVPKYVPQITLADFDGIDDRQFNFGPVQPQPKDFTQDVHDSYIQSGLSKSFKENVIKKNEDKIYENADKKKQEKINEIIKYAGPENSAKVKKVLDLISQRNNKMVLYDNKREIDLIYDAFSTGNQNVRNQILLVLSEIELEGVKNDKLDICATGTTSRILESTFIDNPQKMPVEKASVEQGMMSKASFYFYEQNKSMEETKENLIKDFSDVYPVDKIEKIINEWGPDAFIR